MHPFSSFQGVYSFKYNIRIYFGYNILKVQPHQHPTLWHYDCFDDKITLEFTRGERIADIPLQGDGELEKKPLREVAALCQETEPVM